LERKTREGIQRGGKRLIGQDSNAPDTSNKGLERLRNKTPSPFSSEEQRANIRAEYWCQNWLEVATELCGMDDGLPARLDGLELSKSKHRVERLKALGNAIVPQVAVEIMHSIKSAEEGR
jgi:hypothetical protein